MVVGKKICDLRSRACFDKSTGTGNNLFTGQVLCGTANKGIQVVAYSKSRLKGRDSFSYDFLFFYPLQVDT